MTQPAPATIPATEVRTLRSRQVDQEYCISVARPYGKESVQTGRGGWSLSMRQCLELNEQGEP